jgi:large subunit ribosomal protein L25
VADNVDLQAREREGRGKNAARRLRASGMVPAVLYGDGDGSSTALAIPDKIVDYTLHHLGDNARAPPQPASLTFSATRCRDA